MKKAMKACIGPSGKLLLLSQSLPPKIYAYAYDNHQRNYATHAWQHFIRA